MDTIEADCPVDTALPTSLAAAKSLLDEQLDLHQQLNDKQKLVDAVRQQADELTTDKEASIPGVQQLNTHLQELGK